MSRQCRQRTKLSRLGNSQSNLRPRACRAPDRLQSARESLLAYRRYPPLDVNVPFGCGFIATARKTGGGRCHWRSGSAPAESDLSARDLRDENAHLRQMLKKCGRTRGTHVDDASRGQSPHQEQPADRRQPDEYTGRPRGHALRQPGAARRRRAHPVGRPHARRAAGKRRRRLRSTWPSFSRRCAPPFTLWAAMRLAWTFASRPIPSMRRLRWPSPSCWPSTNSSSTRCAMPFPAGRTGSIVVRLRCIGGQLRVLVADDGVGLPDGHAEGQSGYGMKLVRMMAEQVNGVSKSTAARGPGSTSSCPTPGLLHRPSPAPSRLTSRTRRRSPPRFASCLHHCSANPGRPTAGARALRFNSNPARRLGDLRAAMVSLCFSQTRSSRRPHQGRYRVPER